MFRSTHVQVQIREATFSHLPDLSHLPNQTCQVLLPICPTVDKMYYSIYYNMYNISPWAYITAINDTFFGNFCSMTRQNSREFLSFIYTTTICQSHFRIVMWSGKVVVVLLRYCVGKTHHRSIGTDTNADRNWHCANANTKLLLVSTPPKPTNGSEN